MHDEQSTYSTYISRNYLIELEYNLKRQIVFIEHVNKTKMPDNLLDNTRRQSDLLYHRMILNIWGLNTILYNKYRNTKYV